jgi:dihydroorotate dehydrogenase
MLRSLTWWWCMCEGVSVYVLMGTWQQSLTDSCLACSRWSAGATIIEANLSCPNVGEGQGALYTDAQQVGFESRAITRTGESESWL